MNNRPWTVIGVVCGTMALLTFACAQPPPPATGDEVDPPSSAPTTAAVQGTPGLPPICEPGEDVACSSTNSSGEVFREVFNGNPVAPESKMNRLDRWFAQPTMQGPSGWALSPEPMMAQHGPDCAGPPAVHPISTFEDSVFSCKDHLMTAINPPSSGTASGVVSLKPDHLVDLSKGEAVVSVDVSTLSPSKGDWWEIWITPPEDHLVAPADHWFHQAGRPEKALFFQVIDLDDKKFWAGMAFDDYRFAGGTEKFWEGPNIRPLVSMDDKRRDTYELRITRDRVKMLVESSETGELVQVDEFAIPPGILGDEAVVQFVQSNYEPEKHGKHGCGACLEDTTIPATWHWDNVEIRPAKPYTLIGTQEYMVHGGSPSKQVTFNEPAPGDTDLMFVSQSRGNAPELSFDGGITWVTATAVRPPNDPPVAGWGGDPDLLTYRVPVPAGTASATVRGTDTTSTLSWVAMNFHLIARNP